MIAIQKESRLEVLREVALLGPARLTAPSARLWGRARSYKRRTHVVRIFPNEQSCLRLIRALAMEAHENWIEATRYLNLDLLREHHKLALRCVEQAASVVERGMTGGDPRHPSEPNQERLGLFCRT